MLKTREAQARLWAKVPLFPGLSPQILQHLLDGEESGRSQNIPPCGAGGRKACGAPSRSQASRPRGSHSEWRWDGNERGSAFHGPTSVYSEKPALKEKTCPSRVFFPFVQLCVLPQNAPDVRVMGGRCGEMLSEVQCSPRFLYSRGEIMTAA